MSLFSWFSRKPEPIRHRPVVDPSVLLGADATVPLTPTRHFRPAAATPAPQYGADPKNDRVQRRELLYAVVRDAMVRAGVLSASYKFKVLSLDQRGRQFLVMIDVARLLGSTYMAETMFHGVRVGGHEIFKQSFSWGFGRAPKAKST